MLKEVKDGILLNIRISPNASKCEFIKNGGELKVKITAPPVDGKANKCLIEFLSKSFKVPKSYIEIVKGETSKDKTILFSHVSEESLAKIKAVVLLQ